MDICVVFVVRTVAWNVKWHEGRKDLNSTKMDQREKNPGQAKKKKIPPGAWMSVCCEWCVLSGRGLCDGLITRPEESYRLWCVSNVCDQETSTKRWGPGPYKAVEPYKKNIGIRGCIFLTQVLEAGKRQIYETTLSL
jgi:hypothetical protein